MTNALQESDPLLFDVGVVEGFGTQFGEATDLGSEVIPGKPNQVDDLLGGVARKELIVLRGQLALVDISHQIHLGQKNRVLSDSYFILKQLEDFRRHLGRSHFLLIQWVKHSLTTYDSLS